MEYKEITFGSGHYDHAIALRYAVLRRPLGLFYDPEVLAKENSDHHLCAFTPENKLVACLIMTPVDKDMVKMRQFAVDTEYQQMGIGRTLVSFAEEWAAKQGYRNIALHARLTAVPFYEKLDYHAEGDVFTEVTIPHRYMYKNLPPKAEENRQL